MRLRNRIISIRGECLELKNLIFLSIISSSVGLSNILNRIGGEDLVEGREKRERNSFREG